MRGHIGLRSFGFNQQQRVVQLYVRIAELEPIELFVVMPIGRSEEIVACRAFDDCLL
jgi:hypothetical protein